MADETSLVQTCSNLVGLNQTPQFGYFYELPGYLSPVLGFLAFLSCYRSLRRAVMLVTPHLLLWTSIRPALHFLTVRPNTLDVCSAIQSSRI